MTMRLSKLFGMDIYTSDAEYKGKVYDLVINLEKGKLETITTAPLKPRSKQEAKKIISEKSIPYKNVKAAKDIILVSGAKSIAKQEPEPDEATIGSKPQTTRSAQSAARPSCRTQLAITADTSIPTSHWTSPRRRASNLCVSL